MKNLTYIIIIAATLLAVSCTKELDIDYNNITPFYVVQGEITNKPAKALLTMSRNMDDAQKAVGIGAAEMVLSDDLGKSETLVFGSDGYYHAPSGWTGETGRTYTLKVRLNGKEYTASSTMRPAVTLDSVHFVWLSSAGMKMMLMKCMHTFPKGEDLSYTYLTFTKNGNFYRNHTDKQINPDNTKGQVLVGCTTEKVMEENDPEKQDVILHEGDKVHCELWSIDKNVHQYFTSLKSSQQNASTPITNFSAGITGYFSAHHVSEVDLEFHLKDVKE